MEARSTQIFDVVVMGSGPGGEGAAMQAAKDGLKVAMIEQRDQVGGSCTHLGTIPSKALRQVAHRLVTFNSDPLFSRYCERQLRFSDMMARAKEVIMKQVQIRQGHYDRNQVTIFHGMGSLQDEQTVIVKKKTGPSERVKAKSIIIATGSRPYHPEGIDFSHPRIFDSDTILDLQSTPRIVSIYGAGVVGCEYTSIFRSLGRKINLINTRDQLLSFLDEEIIDALGYHLRDQGVIIRHNETLDKVETRDEEVVLHLKSGKKIKSDILLVASGRRGNTEDLGLAKIGVEVNERNQIVVNKQYQTTHPNIFAVGDVTGFPALASAAYDQGRFAARAISNPHTDDRLVKDIPVGIYTSPEISCIGKTEKELTQAMIPYEVGHVAFRHLARAQITDQTVGMLKILFHRETLEILGIHCFGQNASEIIHIGQAIMAQKGEANTLKYFVNTTFNYPTMAEAYRVAALNGMNRLCM